LKTHGESWRYNGKADGMVKEFVKDLDIDVVLDKEPGL